MSETEEPADDQPTVLVVEDEEELRRTYELWLAGDYEVVTAAEGEEALDIVAERAADVEVVLLDRMMPGLSGKETLERMRERGVEAKFAMVTAVEPDFDIIEMGFDAYLTKPIDEDRLRDTISSLRSQEAYSDALDEYTSLLAKKETLKARKSEEELAESDAYAELEARLAELETELEDADSGAGDDAGFVAALRSIDEGAQQTEPEES
ncbi:response regulator [Haloglomus litoreum]|uniref:response regulator n=1 Tax=Haloglomus litoreum TaxID=3034026 RepID=UPI0023E7A76A|nr:response regulator [Haloglomus sp. DT116]